MARPLCAPVLLNVKISGADKHRLDLVVDLNSTTKSKFVRTALRDALARELDKEPPSATGVVQ